MELQIVSFIVNGLMGVAMYFMKQAHDSQRDKVNSLETKIEKVHDSTVKKEDFREFKEELWLRFDKMEGAFEKRLQRGSL